MKIRRNKKVQRYLNFFRNNYEFRKPYQVLLDGTICQTALKHQVNIKEQFPKYLDGDAKLLSTPCVILEMEKLGGMVYGAMVILKQFAVHKCGHNKKPVPASECLESMLGVKNANRYIIATQDRQLQAIARKIPGTPLLYLHMKTPVFEQPSEVSVRMARLNSQSVFALSQQEATVLSTLKGDSGGEQETIKKKKRKKGKNPLSCKKKKKKKGDRVQANKTETDLKTTRKRKRIKIPKHLKEHWIAQAKSTLDTENK